MTTFVLVAGAWHGAWCWERVVPLMAEAGHRVLTPDLPGMGADPTPLAEVTLARWADAIAAVVAAEPEPVILIGHSRGGIVISEVAERVPDRIALLLYLAAFLLPSGETLLDAARRGPKHEGPKTMIPSPDGSTRINPEAAGPVFYSLTAPEWIERAAAQLGPEPAISFATPLALTEARFGRVRRAYVECTEDRAVPLALQRAMQAALPCDPVCTLATDHSPFFSAPEALVACFARLAVGA